MKNDNQEIDMSRSTLSTVSRRMAAHAHTRIVIWRDEPERGDVPGWVLITVMTAGLVAALWLVAEPLLRDMFSSAVQGVGGP